MLHESEKSLEFDVMRLADVQYLIEAFDRLRLQEGYVHVRLEVLHCLVLVEKTREPGHEVRLFRVVPAHGVPKLQGALGLKLLIDFVSLMTLLLYL